ncbi:MAG: hypothetical protein ABI440_01380 [Casimicrobiaceae bacterium]
MPHTAVFNRPAGLNLFFVPVRSTAAGNGAYIFFETTRTHFPAGTQVSAAVEVQPNTSGETAFINATFSGYLVNQ